MTTTGGVQMSSRLSCHLKNPYKVIIFIQDVGLWLEEINLGGYRQVFEENGVNGEYLESLSMFTTEQILRFIRRCHMKWGDFITLCKELRRIKGLYNSVFFNLAIHIKESSTACFFYLITATVLHLYSCALSVSLITMCKVAIKMNFQFALTDAIFLGFA
jgi:hypothetical protein